MIAGGAWFAGFIALGTIAACANGTGWCAAGAYGHYVVVGGLAIALALPLAGRWPGCCNGPSLAVRRSPSLAAGRGAVDRRIAGDAPRTSRCGRPAGRSIWASRRWRCSPLRAGPDHGLWLVLILFLPSGPPIPGR